MRNKTVKYLKWILMIYLCMTILLPLLSLLTHISAEDFKTIFTSQQFVPMLVNSLLSAGVTTLVSVSLALVLAWCVNRTRIKGKSVLMVLFTLPMLIPSISHGMGLSLLFGDNGVITNFLGINIHLYGLTGIVIGATLYSFPVAFLMLSDIFQYEDFTVYESAQVLGLSKFQQFRAITLSNLKKPLISAVFAVFTMVFTDYGVPLVVGGKMMTLPVYMYREVIGLLDYSKGAIIGIILLLPAVIAFLSDLKNDESGSGSTVTKPYIVYENKKRDRFAYIFCGILIFLISLPIITFMILSVIKQYPIDFSLTFANIQKAFQLGIGNYLLNSLFISLTTALLGMFVSFFTAYITARSQKKFSTMTLHLLSLVSLAIPGIVLGLSYVLFYKGSIIYGTMAILITVNITHFFASPYLMAYNSLSKFNSNLEDIAATLGISKWRMLLDVYMPCTMSTMIEMFSYIFVNAMVTISAVSFLANLKNMPLALLIPQFDSQSLIEATAFISIVILAVNLIAKLIVYLLKNYVSKKEAV